MNIRTATLEDLPTILALGKEFGHQMLYQKDPDVMAMYLDKIFLLYWLWARSLDTKCYTKKTLMLWLCI